MLLQKYDIKPVVQLGDVVHGDVAALALLVEQTHRVLGRDLAVLTGSQVDTNIGIPQKKNTFQFQFSPNNKNKKSPALKVHSAALKVYPRSVEVKFVVLVGCEEEIVRDLVVRDGVEEGVGQDWVVLQVEIQSSVNLDSIQPGVLEEDQIAAVLQD